MADEWNIKSEADGKPVRDVNAGLTNEAGITNVENKDPFAAEAHPARANQQIVMPTAVTTRSLGQLISITNVAYTTTTIPDSNTTQITGTLTNTTGFIVMAVPFWSLYTGISDPADISSTVQWPNSSYAGGNFPVYINPADWGRSSPTNTNQKTEMVIRNSSGGPVTVLSVLQWRLISQPSNPGGAGSSS